MKYIILLALLALSACSTTVKETFPSTTATEQYLIAQSANNAMTQFKVTNPTTLGKVYLDASEFDGSKYTLAEVQTILLKDGVAFAKTESDADTIMSVRVGVQSIDNRIVDMGLPSIPIPLPVPGITLAFPALTFLKKDQSLGITVIGLTAWNAKTGLLVDDLGEKLGLSYSSIWSSAATGTWEVNDFPINPRP
jgi:hypothetical protein